MYNDSYSLDKLKLATESFLELFWAFFCSFFFRCLFGEWVELGEDILLFCALTAAPPLSRVWKVQRTI